MPVAAKRDSGYYETATITDVTNKQVTGTVTSSVNGSSGDKFLLKFEDGTSQWYLERQIIGQGKENSPTSARFCCLVVF